MRLLLHSLGLPWLVCILWSHFVILWAYGPLFLSFELNGLYIAVFFLHLFYIVGLLLPLSYFCQKWASTLLYT